VTPNMGAISNTQVESGRFSSDGDNQRRQPVTFIGAEMIGQVLERREPGGQNAGIFRGAPFEVIGVARAKGSVFGQSRTTT